MNHLIRTITSIIIFAAIFLITAPLKLIFCIWDWKWEFEGYFESIAAISFNVVDFDS